MAPRHPTLIDALVAQAARRPDAPFLAFAGEQGARWTFGAALHHARVAATALVQAGLGAGDRLVIVGGNEPATVAALLGAMGLGAVPAIIHPPLRAGAAAARAQLGHALARSGARLVVGRGLAPQGGARVLDPAALATAGGPLVELSPPAPAALAYLQFSSGTTGAQKAVAIEAGAQAVNAELTGTAVGVGDDETWVIWLPLYHDMGLMAGLLIPLYFGHQVVLMTPEEFVARPRRWLEVLSATRGTLTVAPNFAYALIARRMGAEPGGLDLSALRVAYNGAEMVRAETVTAFEQVLAPVGVRAGTVLPVYGLAEMTLSAAFWRVGEPIRVDRITRAGLGRGVAEPAPAGERRSVPLVSVGRALDGHALRVVDERGAPRPERRVGEIEVRGPSRMRGYYGDEARTRAVFDGDWLRTGDLGYVADGDLFICGRSKDVVIRFGENYFPDDLEAVAAGAPGVRPGRLAMLGVEDGRLGSERVWLVVECSATGAAAERFARAVRDFVRDTAGFKFDGVAAVPPGFVPKTSSGKVSRAACRDRLAAAARAGAFPPAVGVWPAGVPQAR